MLKTTVCASSKYDILIKRGILKDCGRYIKDIISPCKALIIADDNTDKFYGKIVLNSLKENGFSVIEYVFPAGEQSKSVENLESISEFAAVNHLTRSDVIIALGGGVCGDLSGFVASVYLRGIPFIQIPTTLLAAVDSSVGGKVAVNLKNGKNLMGAFHQPSLVIMDPDVFKTLPSSFYKDGIAESIKYGILEDKNLFDMFKGDTTSVIEETIKKCTEIKSRIVSNDEFDKGERQLLNLGHTFGHAIEILSGFSITHGHAVAIGTVIVSKAAEKMNISQKGTTDEIVSVYSKCGLPTSCPYGKDEILNIALKDKKRNRNEITLVLPEKVGKCILHKINIRDLEEFIEKGLS